GPASVPAEPAPAPVEPVAADADPLGLPPPCSPAVPPQAARSRAIARASGARTAGSRVGRGDGRTGPPGLSRGRRGGSHERIGRLYIPYRALVESARCPPTPPLPEAPLPVPPAPGVPAP